MLPNRPGAHPSLSAFRIYLMRPLGLTFSINDDIKTSDLAIKSPTSQSMTTAVISQLKEYQIRSPGADSQLPRKDYNIWPYERALFLMVKI